MKRTKRGIMKVLGWVFYGPLFLMISAVGFVEKCVGIALDDHYRGRRG